MKKRSNFTPMERFHEILIGHGLDATNVGINHIRISWMVKNSSTTIL